MSYAIPTIPFWSAAQYVVNHEPQIKAKDLSRLIHTWIQKQRHWPKDLKADHLSKNLKLWYINQSTVSGSGSAEWSAEIGFKATESDIISWRMERRYLYRHVTNYTYFKVPAHTATEIGQEQALLSEEELKLLLKYKEQVVPTRETSYTATQFARKTIQVELKKQAKEIASGLGDEARALRLDKFKATNVEVERRQYPLYLGTYTYGGQDINIQIDGFTGELYITPPKGVKTRKEIEMSLVTLVMLWVGIALTFLMFAIF